MGQESGCKQCPLGCLVYLFRFGYSEYLSWPNAAGLLPHHNQDLEDRGSSLKVQKCLVPTAFNETKLGKKFFVFC